MGRRKKKNEGKTGVSCAAAAAAFRVFLGEEQPGSPGEPGQRPSHTSPLVELHELNLHARAWRPGFRSATPEQKVELQSLALLRLGLSDHLTDRDELAAFTGRKLNRWGHKCSFISFCQRQLQSAGFSALCCPLWSDQPAPSKLKHLLFFDLRNRK